MTAATLRTWPTAVLVPRPVALVILRVLERGNDSLARLMARNAGLDLDDLRRPAAPAPAPAARPGRPSPSPRPGLRWQDRAACRGTDPEAFYPEKGGSTAEAKAVCAVCPVRAECLEYALGQSWSNDWGVWGGTSEQERERMRRERRAADRRAA